MVGAASLQLPSYDRAWLDQLGQELIDTCLRMNESGLNQGRSGNLSLRLDAEHFLITPSGIDYAQLRPRDLPIMSLRGAWWGPLRPSTEWRFHRDLLAARPQAQAVLHAHSKNATALACLGQGIPAFHYMVAVAGGDHIACAPYATFGTAELSRHALAALEGRKACLLANHGLLAYERDLDRVFALAMEVETLAEMYRMARQLGEPNLLEPPEMARVLELFRTYGTPDFPDTELIRMGQETGTSLSQSTPSSSAIRK